VDWSLLGCGRAGHVTYAPDEPELREQLTATTATGEAWRCLRCAAFVAGEPDGHGPSAEAPEVRRGKEIRSALILRIFAVERFVRAVVFLALAVLLWRFKFARQSIESAFDRERPILRELFRQLGFNINHSKLVGLIQHALTLSSRAITLLAVGVTLYVVVEAIEGVGLWLTRRWGEYFAMIATSFGLPLEIYDLTRKVTVTALLFLGVNLLLVAYLVLTKRLFGVRGGKRAYDARLRSDSVMELAIEAAEAARAARGVTGAAPVPAASDAPASESDAVVPPPVRVEPDSPASAPAPAATQETAARPAPPATPSAAPAVRPEP
jgi:uncharacterized membrane protein (DUF2068 family)